MFATVAKQILACEVEMPSSLLMEMHAHLLRTAQFGCSFIEEALRAWAVNKVSITREKDELKKTVKYKRGTLSVQNAMDLFTELQLSLEKRMQVAQETRQHRQKAAMIVLKTTEGRKVARTQGAEDPYLAAREFSNMRNKPQDRVDMGQRKRVFPDAGRVDDRWVHLVRNHEFY